MDSTYCLPRDLQRCPSVCVSSSTWVWQCLHYFISCSNVEPELLPCLRKFGISFYEYNPRKSTKHRLTSLRAQLTIVCQSVVDSLQVVTHPPMPKSSLVRDLTLRKVKGGYAPFPSSRVSSHILSASHRTTVTGTGMTTTSEPSHISKPPPTNTTSLLLKLLFDGYPITAS